MTIEKTYKNFNEITKEQVILLEVWDDEKEPDDNWMENYQETILDALNFRPNDFLTSHLELSTEEVENEEETIQKLEEEYIEGLLDCTYQIFKVDLVGDYNNYHALMNIYYSETLKSYMLPVYGYGISWNQIAPY